MMYLGCKGPFEIKDGDTTCNLFVCPDGLLFAGPGIAKQARGIAIDVGLDMIGLGGKGFLGEIIREIVGEAADATVDGAEKTAAQVSGKAARKEHALTKIAQRTSSSADLAALLQHTKVFRLEDIRLCALMGKKLILKTKRNSGAAHLLSARMGSSLDAKTISYFNLRMRSYLNTRVHSYEFPGDPRPAGEALAGLLTGSEALWSYAHS
jgi:hypothetical protein